MYKLCKDLWIAGELLQVCEESNQNVSFLDSYMKGKRGISDKDLILSLNFIICIIFAGLFFLCGREAIKICFKRLKDS